MRQEDSNLSDLAKSCEYLTIEKLCSAVSESEKAKASRHVRCQNDEKMTCCYLCLSRRECVTPCKFLGNIGPVSPVIEAKKAEAENVLRDDKEPQIYKDRNVPVTCSECYIEMAQAKTKFNIVGWEGLNPKFVGASGKLGEELPAIVYICPQCGKIEFRADEKLNKN